MRTKFKSPRRTVVVDTYGPEPVGQAGAGTLYTYLLGIHAGGQLGGTPHFGERGDPAVTFSGLISSPQNFVGAAQMGANANPAVQEYPALPHDSAPPATVRWLQDWTQLEGLVAQGE